jgi:hypothetical protein
MAEFREDTGIYPVMIALATCATEELVKSGLTAIDKVTIQPGLTPVQDYVGNGDDCGEIIVNLTSTFPSDPFPSPVQNATCAVDLAYEVQLGIFRCAPAMEVNEPPSPAEQLNATRENLADMAAMHRAIRCCMQTMSRAYSLRAFAPYGPSGNVVGGIWTVIVGQEL